jgi:glucose-6-phosphate 1-epimerase
METIDFHGLPAVRWTGADGASAVATLHGAQLVSWIPAGGGEAFYVSERSAFERGRPLRGGVPVVFPQFGERGPLPHHGFVRTMDWRVASGEGSRVVFALESSPQSRKLWAHEFALELAVTLGGAGLDIELYVRNSGKGSFSFNAALHTYFRVADAQAARLGGLKGTAYVDRSPPETGIEAREWVTARRAIDRVYLSAPHETHLEDAGRRLAIAQRGFPDTVVWNPGRDATKPDLPPDGYRHMLCVEAAAFNAPIVLSAGNEWTGGQSIVATVKR